MQLAIYHSQFQLDLSHAISQAGLKPVYVSTWQELQLNEYAGIILLQAIPKTAYSQLIQYAELGHLILGMGEGATALLETGIIPGLENREVAITIEKVQQPESAANLTLSKEYQHNAFTGTLPRQEFFILAKDLDSKFIIPKALLMELKIQGLNIFMNAHSIQALANKSGNAMAMLPDAVWDTQSGAIWKSVKQYLSLPTKPKVAPLKYTKKRTQT